MNQVFSFEVWVHGSEWPPVVVTHRTAGKAKYQLWLGVTDCYPDVPITAMRARKLKDLQTSDRLRSVARYRGLPSIQAGQRIQAGELRGVIVDGNSSANFNVLLDDDCPKWPGQVLNIHPQEIVLV